MPWRFLATAAAVLVTQAGGSNADTTSRLPDVPATSLSSPFTVERDADADANVPSSSAPKGDAKENVKVTAALVGAALGAMPPSSPGPSGGSGGAQAEASKVAGLLESMERMAKQTHMVAPDMDASTSPMSPTTVATTTVLPDAIPLNWRVLPSSGLQVHSDPDISSDVIGSKPQGAKLSGWLTVADHSWLMLWGEPGYVQIANDNEVFLQKEDLAPQPLGSTTLDAAMPLPCTEQLADLANAGSSPAAAYLHGFGNWLAENPYQPLMATVSVLIGAVCAWDGPRFWHALFTTGVAACAAGIASYEATAQQLPFPSQMVMMVQVTMTAVLAAHLGFEGSQVLLGAALGCAAAFSWGEWARIADDKLPGVACLWYASGATGGMMVSTAWRKQVLATVAPLMGGFLVAAGLGALARVAVGHGEGLPLPPPGSPWSRAAMALLGGGGLSTLAGHVICALLAVLLYGWDDLQRRLPAVICLVAGVLLTAFVSAAGAMSPSLLWLHPENDEDRGWTAFGCLVWAAVSAASGWWQLGQLKDWESHVYLSRIYLCTGLFGGGRHETRYMELPGTPDARTERAEQEAADQPSMLPHSRSRDLAATDAGN